MPTGLPSTTKTPPRALRFSSRPFEMSCAAIAVVTIGLAVFIDRFCNDRTGAVLILLMVSVLIGLLHSHGRRRKE